MPLALRRTPRFAAPAAGALLALLLAAPDPALARQGTGGWAQSCVERNRGNGGRVTHCEVREATLPAPAVLQVSARPNGGVEVTGASRTDVHLTARVQAWAESEAEAREVAAAVRLETSGGRISATGPRARGGRSWSVSYLLSVPHRTDLDLGTVNGGLSVREVEGDLALSTTNGGISMEAVGGRVNARTTNGAVRVRLAGDRWTGEALELQTTNGGISLSVPPDFAASLSARTVHGGIRTDFPVTVQGRIGRTVDAEIGGGGPPVRLSTTNGGIEIRRN